GFPLDSTPQCERQVREAIAALEAADAWSRVRTALQDGAAALAEGDPGMPVPDLQLLLLAGDPTNHHFLDEIQGLSAFGGISGYISVTVWPTELVLDRLEAIAVHELHHNVRYSPGGVVWDPDTVTVGEHVVAEGLADLFAAELYGDRGYTHFASEDTRTDDAVLAKVASGLNVTGMADFASWVLGDASARLFGGQPVGLPTGAGYAAGARIGRADLSATGTTAAQNVRTPTSDILRVALPPLGLNEAGARRAAHAPHTEALGRPPPGRRVDAEPLVTPERVAEQDPGGGGEAVREPAHALARRARSSRRPARHHPIDGAPQPHDGAPQSALLLGLAAEWFAERSVTIERVMSDNGGAYRVRRPAARLTIDQRPGSVQPDHPPRLNDHPVQRCCQSGLFSKA